MSMDNRTPYEQIGGAETLARLVDIFYNHVKRHPDLAALFPEDLTPVKERQYQFLTQFLGGPTLYSDIHGHPMLRARHMRFPIGTAQAAAWLACMEKAMTQAGLTGDIRDQIFDRLRLTAHHMINQWESKEEA